MKILFYGYGNPGRQDDGLGVSLVEELEKWAVSENIPNMEFDTNYQLNIEDADAIQDKDIVFFADATIESIDDFIITRVDPSEAHIEFTMHAMSPSFILDLCQKMYNRHPETFLIHIKGYEYELREGLTEKAEENMRKTLQFMKSGIKEFLDKKDIGVFIK